MHLSTLIHLKSFLFKKRNILYGLHEANIYDDTIIVTEGYIDTITMYQYGLENSVATLGTAISEYQIDKIFKYASTIIYCFDGDIAGKKAAWRALCTTLTCMEDGKRVNFYFLPTGYDPDQFIRKYGIKVFKERIQNHSISIDQFFFKKITQNIDLNTMDARAKLAKTVDNYLSKIKQCIFKQLMYQKLSKLIEIDPKLIINTKKEINYQK